MTKSQHETTPAISGPLVCVLAYDGLCTFEFGIAAELFALPRPEFDNWYRYTTVAIDTGHMRAAGGLTVMADGGLELLDGADLIVVPGWRGVDAPVPDPLVMALVRAHGRGARIASICSGVFVLGAAGLLDGRRATTHWRYTDVLAARFPKAEILPDVLYVDEGSVLTSAGSAAGLDMGLHIIRSDYGVEYANSVARRLVLPAQRDGGQRQFLTSPVSKIRGGRIAPLLDHIRETLSDLWPVARMATEAGLSERTLARRFKEATGQTPLGWLTATRVARAAELLETKDDPLAQIAETCGFGSIESFRAEFRRQHGIAPSRYRAAFGKDTSSETRPSHGLGQQEPHRFRADFRR